MVVGASAISPASVEERARKIVLAVSLVLNVTLIVLVAASLAELRRATALAGAAFDREHRLVVDSMKLRASSAAMTLGCKDTGNALAACTARLAACWAKERREP